MARKAKKSKTNVKVNFKGVESRRTPPEGDYKCKVLEATNGTSGAGNDQIEFICEIAAGEYKGQKLYLYCPLQDNSLWKLHAFLTALGVDVPEDDMDIDLSELVDEEFMGVITHETYNGRKRAKLTDFDSIENYNGDADEEDDEDDGKKSKGKKSKKGKSKSKSDDDDEDDEPKKGKKSSKKDEPDYDEMDEDELRDLYIELELGTKKAAKKLDEDELREALEEAAAASSKKSKKSKKDDDDEDEDDEPKSKKGKGKKSKKKTYDRDEVEDMDEDELGELLEEAGLDDEVDLSEYKKLSKKVAAVIEALEEAELLDD